MKRIEDLIWHDGQLVSFVAEFTKERTWTTRLSIDVYPDDAASERQRVCVECHRVERSSTIFDFVELLDNHNAGNIANGYVKRFGKKFKRVAGMPESLANEAIRNRQRWHQSTNSPLATTPEPS